MGASTGSVARCRNWTMGFRGSGLTQETRARATMIHQYAHSAMFRTAATALSKFPAMNIKCLPIAGQGGSQLSVLT
jgi:hypothetical protein